MTDPVRIVSKVHTRTVEREDAHHVYLTLLRLGEPVRVEPVGLKVVRGNADG